MGEQLVNVLNLIKDNYYNILICGVIMVSTIIVLIGVLKPLLFNRVSNKYLRKALLALSDLVFSAIATAVCFWIEQVSFDQYLLGTFAVFVMVVVTYWFYENTCLRNLIEKIGKFALNKIAVVVVKSATNENIDLKAELKNTSTVLKKATATELKATVKTTVKDKELKNL